MVSKVKRGVQRGMKMVNRKMKRKGTSNHLQTMREMRKRIKTILEK